MKINKLRIVSSARGLREMLGLSSIESVQNIDKVISDSGYIYQEESLGEKYSAFCVYLGNEQYGIIFNTDHYWNERFRRFTIAHELGHITMPHHSAVLKSVRKHKSRPEFQSEDPLEREADLFAINFLVPREAFEQKAKYQEFNKETIQKLASVFNISILAACFRFIELTDLVTVLIVSDSNGKIKYEKRSREFRDLIKHEYLKGYSVRNTTQTYEMINSHNQRSLPDCEIYLNEWYPALYEKFPCNESALNLGYNDSFVTMLSITDHE